MLVSTVIGLVQDGGAFAAARLGAGGGGGVGSGSGKEKVAPLLAAEPPPPLGEPAADVGRASSEEDDFVE